VGVRAHQLGRHDLTHATGAESAEANQGLFIFRKAAEDGGWKIARYSFSSTNPPPAA
jgi:hypothetical protein